MESKSSFCFVDIAPSTTTVTTSLSGEARQWHVATPARVAAAAASTQDALLTAGSTEAVDTHLASIATASHLASIEHIFFLTRDYTTQKLFELYVLRWLRSACPATTTVATMPLPLFATQRAGVASALVVDCTAGLLTCTPVLEGVVATEAAGHWGDARVYARTPVRSMAGCWRDAGCAVVAALTAASDGAESDRDAVSATTAEPQAWWEEVPFMCEVRQHVQQCRLRELDACLSTVLLCGDVATVREARYCMGLVLSLLLPDSAITWC